MNVVGDRFPPGFGTHEPDAAAVHCKSRNRRSSLGPILARWGACKIKCVTGYHHCFINEGGVDDQEKYENRCAESSPKLVEILPGSPVEVRPPSTRWSLCCSNPVAGPPATWADADSL